MRQGGGDGWRRRRAWRWQWESRTPAEPLREFAKFIIFPKLDARRCPGASRAARVELCAAGIPSLPLSPLPSRPAPRLSCWVNYPVVLHGSLPCLRCRGCCAELGREPGAPVARLRMPRHARFACRAPFDSGEKGAPFARPGLLLLARFASA